MVGTISSSRRRAGRRMLTESIGEIYRPESSGKRSTENQNAQILKLDSASTCGKEAGKSEKSGTLMYAEPRSGLHQLPEGIIYALELGVRRRATERRHTG